jgi:hypothetical protein
MIAIITDDKALGGNIGLPAMAGSVINPAFVHLKIFRALGQVYLIRHCGKPRTVTNKPKNLLPNPHLAHLPLCEESINLA